MPEPLLDRFIQRVTLLALLATAAALVATGVSLYGPRARGAEATIQAPH
jgi:hypothetical protein